MVEIDVGQKWTYDRSLMLSFRPLRFQIACFFEALLSDHSLRSFSDCFASFLTAELMNCSFLRNFAFGSYAALAF